MANADISADEIADWYTPMEAWGAAYRSVGESGASDAVWARVKGGMVRIAASTSSETYGTGAPIPRLTPMLIPGRYWAKFTNHGSDFWNGDARFFFDGDRHSKSITTRCFGIKLDPVGFKATLPPPRPVVAVPEPTAAPVTTATENPPPAPAAKHPGGRPKYDWWDLMWAEIGRQLAKGELRPQQQKEIELAMKTFAENYEPDIADSTIRIRAQKLAKALGIKVEN